MKIWKSWNSENQRAGLPNHWKTLQSWKSSRQISNSDKNNSKDEISENESHDEISEENNSCDSDDYDKLFKKVKNLQKKLTKK